MNEVTIREYQEDDCSVVCVVHDLARPIELEKSCDQRAFVPLTEDAEGLKEFHQAQKLVACIEEIVIGFVGATGSEISWLYVHPDHFNRGVGRKLLEEGLARVSEKAELYVLDGNDQAMALYESVGFREMKRYQSDNNGYACTVLKLTQ